MPQNSTKKITRRAFARRVAYTMVMEAKKRASRMFFRQRLFQAHLQDLQSLEDFEDLGIADGVFVCPICGNQYTEDSNQFSIGHVWPDVLRKGNRFHSHAVLLCEYCNHTAGSRGDAQIGRAIEEAEAHATRRYPERRMIFRSHENPREPLKINASISILDVEEGEGSSGTITLSPMRNNPANIRRLKGGEKFDVSIEPHPLLRPQLVQAGWVTSAFLLAFYALGYRYMLSAAAEQIRNYLWSSFNTDEPALPECVRIGSLPKDEAPYVRPEILITIPLNPIDLVILRIRAQRTVIDLPLPFNPEVLHAILREKAPEIFVATTGKIKWDFPKNSVIEIPIRCTKTQPHECIFDHILGY